MCKTGSPEGASDHALLRAPLPLPLLRLLLQDAVGAAQAHPQLAPQAPSPPLQPLREEVQHPLCPAPPQPHTRGGGSETGRSPGLCAGDDADTAGHERRGDGSLGTGEKWISFGFIYLGGVSVAVL